MISLIFASIALGKPISCKDLPTRKEDTRAILAVIKKLKPGLEIPSARDFFPSIQDMFRGPSSSDTPYLALRDLNKDGKVDPVVFGIEDEHYRLYAFISSQNALNPILVDSVPYYDFKTYWMVVAQPQSIQKVGKEYGIASVFSVKECQLSDSKTGSVIAVGQYSKPSLLYALTENSQAFTMIYMEQ